MKHSELQSAKLTASELPIDDAVMECFPKVVIVTPVTTKQNISLLPFISLKRFFKFSCKTF